MLGVNHLSNASKTLFLPLYYRAVESHRPNPLIFDSIASDLVRRTAFDFSPLEGKNFDRVVAMLRAREFDRCVRQFLSEHSEAVVVEIGCGLDTRFYRVDNGSVRWYELDVPEVAELRRALLEAHPRCELIASSADDIEWMESVQVRSSACLFIAEGVLMYMEESAVKRLVVALADRFAGAELIFDVLSPSLANIVRYDPLSSATRKAAALLRWLPADTHVLERWSPRLHLKSVLRYLNWRERRVGPMRWLFSLPVLSSGSLILHYDLGPARRLSDARHGRT